MSPHWGAVELQLILYNRCSGGGPPWIRQRGCLARATDFNAKNTDPLFPPLEGDHFSHLSLKLIQDLQSHLWGQELSSICIGGCKLLFWMSLNSFLQLHWALSSELHCSNSNFCSLRSPSMTQIDLGCVCVWGGWVQRAWPLLQPRSDENPLLCACSCHQEGVELNDDIFNETSPGSEMKCNCSKMRWPHFLLPRWK